MSMHFLDCRKCICSLRSVADNMAFSEIPLNCECSSSLLVLLLKMWLFPRSLLEHGSLLFTMWILKEHLKPRLIVILIPLAYGLLFTLGAVVHRHGWCCLCFNDNDNDDYYGQHHQTYCQHIFDLPNLVKFPCVLHPPTLPHRVLSSWPCPIHAMRYPAMSRCIYHLSLCTHPRLMVICLVSST